MRIEAIELGVMRVPLRQPFRTALRTVEQAEDVVVRLRTHTGLVGYGSAPPTAAITGDTLASIVGTIRGVLAPKLIGCVLDEPARLDAMIHAAVPGQPSAKAALDIALHDVWAQAQGVPLYRWLGGAVPHLRTDLTISVDTVAAMVASAQQAVALGYRALKIKLGRESSLDIARVLAIHEAVGAQASLRLDANQGWTAEQAVQVMHTLEHAGVRAELLEQPVPARDIDGLAYVTERVETPVVADESVFDEAQAVTLARRGACDIINIKLMKAGGIARALRIADVAAEHGLTCMMGCMLEGAIGVTAAAHVAAARAAVIRVIDLDGPELCRYNPVDGGAHFRGPDITLDDAPGLGIHGVRALETLDDEHIA